MELKKVESSNISKVGYDKETQTLEIEFRNGNSYRYFGVPEKGYTKLLESESKGKFLSKFIKNRFKFEQIEKDKIEMREIKLYPQSYEMPNNFETYMVGVDDKCLVISSGKKNSPKIWLSKMMCEWIGLHGLEEINKKEGGEKNE